MDSTDALSCTIYIYGRHPLLRMRGATRKRSRLDLVQLAESAFSACIGIESDQGAGGLGPVNITCVQYLLIQQFYAIHHHLVFCDRESFLVVCECRDSDQSDQN